MPTKFVFQILYVELIICGFFACVLLARKLCLSETGSPISCHVSRRGNASGRGATDRGTSDPKVKVQSKGEVMNTGERRQQAEAEKGFQQLLLVSKDLYRPAQLKAVSVSATEDGKPWLQKGDEMAGNNGMESQRSEESQAAARRKVMQSHNQGPEEQSLYEFLDLFDVSDWLSGKRRHRVKAAWRTGSKEEKDVDLKTEWHASKAGQDDETEPNSEVKKTRHAASKEKRVDSEVEVFNSVISKGEPVRIKATIVATDFIPRAKILDSEYLTSKAEAVISMPDTVDPKERRVTDTKATPGIPKTPVVSDFQTPSELVKSSKSNTPFVSRETNSDSKALSSSNTLTENAQSKTSASSDDNSGFFAKIWNALFRSYDTPEAAEELAFDDIDFSEASKRDPQTPSDEIRDSLVVSKDTLQDVKDPKENAKKSIEIRRYSIEANETLKAAKNLLDDANNNSSMIAKKHTGGVKDTPAEAKQADENTRAREESTHVVATNASVNSERETLVASLMKEQHNFDQNSKAKYSSNSAKNNSYNAGNGLDKEEHFSAEGKKIRAKAENVNAKAKDIPLKGKDSQLKAKDIPAKEKDIPAKEKDIPAKEKDIPAKAKDIPAKAKDIPAKAKDIPVKAKDVVLKTKHVSMRAKERPVKAMGFNTNTKPIDLKARDRSLRPTDIPSTVEGTTADIRRKSKHVPVKINDIHDKAIHDKVANYTPGVDDSPVNANEKAITAEGIQAKQDVSKNSKDMLSKADNTSAKDETVAKQAKDTSAEKTDTLVSADEPDSTLGRAEVKTVMFTEMDNIMSELDNLGSLWEQLKPGMKLKNSDAVRNVLRSVADVFGLENKHAVQSSRKAELEDRPTEARKLRYGGSGQRTKGDQVQKEFRGVLLGDAPRTEQMLPIGLRSKRSADRLNHRTHVRATYGDERARRDSDYEERKHRRLAKRFNKESGREEQEKEEEELNKKKRQTSRLRKRLGYEDYIFGSNPGYILTRQKRDATSDKVDEDEISRELANLLIEKVYDKVMKTLGAPKKESESPTASDETKGMQSRSKRDSGSVKMSRFCSLIKNRRFNGTDVYGHETDLYRQAVNSGLCLDFEVSQAAEHDVDKRELIAEAENEAEKDDQGEETEVADGEATLEVEGKTYKQAQEEAKREINNVVERFFQSEAKEETQGQAQEEAKRKVKNERVVQTDLKGVAQRQVNEEAQREVRNEVERTFERHAKESEGGTLSKAQEEAKGEIDNEVERVVQTMEIDEEAKREVGKEADSEVREEAKMDAAKESEKDEMLREVRDGPMEFLDRTGDNIAQFGTDAWAFTKEKVTGVIGENNPGVNEKANRTANEELKDKRRSKAKDKTGRNISDILNYLNLKSNEADEKGVER